MNTTFSSTKIFFSFLFTVLLFGLSVIALPVSADDEHSDEELDHHTEMVSDDADREVAMRALLEVLQQLVALLQQKVEMSDDGQQMSINTETVTAIHEAEEVHDHSTHEHDAGHDTESDDLVVWVEIHDGDTHVHLDEPGQEFTTFFLDDIAYTDEAAVIAAIAERAVSATVEEIEAVIVFPTEDAEDYAGIHVMSDGTIMLGDGSELETATITDEGMIMLEDGTLLEPVYDLR